MNGARDDGRNDRRNEACELRDHALLTDALAQLLGPLPTNLVEIVAKLISLIVRAAPEFLEFRSQTMLLADDEVQFSFQPAKIAFGRL